MRNIKMTMYIMQLNSKFVNNMLPEWGRFVTARKLNRRLRDSNYDQLYAYLKQHEAHTNEKKMMLDRFTQHIVDPLALMSNVSQQQYYSQSSTTLPSTHLQPHFADNTSGPVPQRKERCTLQCALSLKEEKSSYLQAVLSITFISSHARLVNKLINYFKPPPNVDHPVPEVPTPVPATSTSSPSSTTVDQDAHSPSHSPSSSALQSPSLQQGVAAESTIMEENPFIPNIFAPEPSSEASSSRDVSSAESTYVTQTHHHLRKWSKDNPLDNVIGNPSRPVSTRKQLAIDALWCLYNFVLSKVEPKNFKSAITEDCWFQAMQDELRLHHMITRKRIT
ncbi:hypothetical protein Tco_0931672 [Tanacetum coccineum]